MGDGTDKNEQVLLKQESLAHMQTPQTTVWKKESWGLTWSIDDTDDIRLVSHGGGTMGQVSQLVLVPEKGFAIAVFTNDDAGGQLTRAVTRLGLRLYAGIDITDPEPMDVDEKVLSQYAGLYSRPFMDI